VSDVIVKSAGRVLEILEFFSNKNGAACLTEIAGTLGYPRSSTSVLLSSLVSMGYLRHDRVARRFLPTLRVAFLGAWIDKHAMLQRQLHSISSLTGETVFLTQRSGLDALCIHVLEARESSSPVVRIGSRRSITRSATGSALLTAMTDSEIERLCRKSNDAIAYDQHVNHRDLLHTVNLIRADGYAAVRRAGSEDTMIISTVMPMNQTPNVIALAVGGPSSRITTKLQLIMDSFGEIGVPIKACGQLPRPVQSDWPLLTATEPFV